MSLNEEQYEKLCFFIQEIEGGKHHLNGWELGFYEDHAKRLEEHGSNIRLSGKQWKCLEDIYRKATGG